MKVRIAKAILELEPTASFSVIEEDLEQIEWYSEDVEQPSNEDIQAKLDELQAIEDAKQYQRDRKAEYPSIEDCVHAILNGWYTFTNLQDARQAIKDKYPKE